MIVVTENLFYAQYCFKIFTYINVVNHSSKLFMEDIIIVPISQISMFKLRSIPNMWSHGLYTFSMDESLCSQIIHYSFRPSKAPQFFNFIT